MEGGGEHLLAKVFGGGQKCLNQMTDVGKRNIDFAMHYLQMENIQIETTDTGDLYPRKSNF